VINTVNAKGVMAASHPLAVGGSPSLPSVREAMAGADVILAVGTEFGETDYDMLFVGELDLPGALIRIDIDGQQLARNVRPALPIVGDARLALAMLGEAVPDAVFRDGAVRAGGLREAVAAEPHVHPDFAALFSAMRAALPGLVLVGDSTLPTYYAVWQYETEAPRSYFHSATGGGTLGYAIPAALGASLARPEVPVVALIGDGSAQFTFAELAAGAEAGLPLAVLIWNNNGYREIKQGMLAASIPPTGVDVPAPDFLQMATALGCEACRVRSLPELESALQASRQAGVPTVIELLQEDFLSLPAGQWY